MNYKVVQSGSKGNAIIYNRLLMVDCGVSFYRLEKYYKKVAMVLLTHIHSDHFKPSTITKLAKERPTMRFACCEWLYNDLIKCGVNRKNIDVLEIGQAYDYGVFKVSPVKLYHDVPNCGYRIFMDGQKIFHATDTAHLEGITAKGYDLYAIEHNYREDLVFEIIAQAKKNNEYCHYEGSINSHLSFEHAEEFIKNNASGYHNVLKLHISSKFDNLGG